MHPLTKDYIRIVVIMIIMVITASLTSCGSEERKIKNLSYSAGKMQVMVDVGYAVAIDTAVYTVNYESNAYKLSAVHIPEYDIIMYPSLSKGAGIRYYTLSLDKD